MKSLSIVLFLLAACDLALAKEVPLPRAKPASLRAAHPPSAAPVPEVLPLYDAEERNAGRHASLSLRRGGRAMGAERSRPGHG